MKKLISIILCLCLCTALLSGCRFSKNDSDSDWEDGYESGYENGHEDGFEEGYNEAELEFEDKYSEGYNDGYYAGATYTCLYFGDIERAFKSAKNGSAWYALIDAYDQYEYDIYDDGDTETRSKLFWALISYMSKRGATDEEYDLLFSAFGTDLYYLDD